MAGWHFGGGVAVVEEYEVFEGVDACVLESGEV